ncbi:MAG: hypothetical protein ACRDBG_26060 [Waterburya sp.]
MAILNTIIQAGNAPDVYVKEQTLGTIGSVTSFTTCYCIVDVPTDVPLTLFPVNTPVQIGSLNDYLNLLGGSIPSSYGSLVSYNSIKAYFNNSAINSVIYVIRTSIPPVSQQFYFPDANLTPSVGTASVQYIRFTINNVPIGLTDTTNGYLGVPIEILATDTLGVVKLKIINAIATFIERDNQIKDVCYLRSSQTVTDLTMELVPRLYGGSLNIGTVTTPIPVGFVELLGYTFNNVSNTVTDNFTVTDYIQTINTAFEDELLSAGVLLVPSGFARLNQVDRISLGQAIERHCRREDKRWFGLVDQGNVDVTRISNYGSTVLFTGLMNVSNGATVRSGNTIWRLTGSSYVAPPNAVTATSVTVGSRVILPQEVTINGKSGRIVQATDPNTGFASLSSPTALELSLFRVITVDDIISERLIASTIQLVETGIDNHSKAYTECVQHVSARGFIGYYAPYLTDQDGFTVPPTGFVAGILTRRISEQGVASSIPAGFQYPLSGVQNPSYKITKANQEISNPIGLNAIRNFPNRGIVINGARTRSTEPLFKFINTRIIVNTIENTLAGSFDNLLFTPLDSLTSIFTRLRTGIETILYNFFVQGFFYPATPDLAYQVIVDSSINPPQSLEDGIVNAQVYIIPALTTERILIAVIRVPIGTLPIPVTASSS